MWPLLLLFACGSDDSTGDSSTTNTPDDTATTQTLDTGTSTLPENTTPTCGITGPEDGSFSEEGDTVTFLGTTDDAEQSPATLSISWSSDKDGVLGTAAATSGGDVVLSINDLSAATHVITLAVTDEEEALCSDYRLFSVGKPPVGTITGPADGTTVDEGDDVSFTAQISDDTTDALDLTVSWVSDIDGEFNTDSAISSGAVAFTTNSLNPGRHTIDLSVTDADGLFSIDALSLTVNAPPSAPGVSLSPSDPDTTDDLVATIDSESTDSDGDPVTYAYAWSLFGTVSSASTDARLPADATTRGDIWTLSLTPTDGISQGEPGESSITIGNAPPSLTGALIEPNPASADDTLSCTGQGFSDADGDSDQSTYEWSVDGSVIGTATTQTGGFGGDDTVTCTLTPSDGTDTGPPVSGITTVGNTAPTIAFVTINPNPAETGDTLTCSWSGFDDADGDSDESFAVWSVNGVSAGSGNTLASGFGGTDTVTCTVTPYDGASTGSPVDASITITNSVPSLGSATISPDPATAADTLVCVTTGWADADGHSDQSTWVWSVNGVPVSTDPSLSSGFTGGDLVACSVTPYDGHDSGSDVSDSLTITNSIPSVSAVTLDPSSAVAGDSLTCSWTFEDADGDSDQSTLVWTVNGSDAGTSTTLSTTLVRGDLVRCTVTPDDGTDAGSTASASLTLSNSAPSVDSVTITPESPATSDGLTCSWSGFDDPDGDTDASTILWTINGVSAGTSASLTSGYIGGDTVDCTITPSDGLTTGVDVSDSTTIDNTAPVLESASVTPSSPNVDDTLTCTPGTISDADGSSAFTYTYDWSVNGTSGAGSSATLAGAFVRGDSVTCTVTPSDGTDSGSASTSDAVTILNAAPVASSISLSPTSPETDDTITASVSTSDPDSDTVSLTYTWSVDGSEVTGETSDSLDGTAHFERDQVVLVTVVPSDGTDSGDSLSSGSLTIANSAPTAPTVTISPEDPAESVNDLLCELTEDSTDPDGDTISYTTAWTVDGGLWTGSTSTTNWSGDTISSGDILAGELWECTMTPDDGDDDGDPASDSVTISEGSTSTCSNQITSMSSPTTIRTGGTTYGAWFSDPLETLGSGMIWEMDNHSGSDVIEYPSMSAFQSGSSSSTLTLPYSWDGTGAIAYDGYLYYNIAGSNDVAKVDLSTGLAIATVNFPTAGYRNDCHWEWGGYSDIDIEVDELGLWVIYGNYSSDCNIVVAKIDEDLNVVDEWQTSSGDRKSLGNAWMTDGVLYVTDAYSDSTTTISYAYDTCAGSDWNPSITFYNDHGYNSSIKYNPLDQLLYSWDQGHQVQYTPSF